MKVRNVEEECNMILIPTDQDCMDAEELELMKMQKFEIVLAEPECNDVNMDPVCMRMNTLIIFGQKCSDKA